MIGQDQDVWLFDAGYGNRLVLLARFLALRLDNSQPLMMERGGWKMNKHSRTDTA